MPDPRTSTTTIDRGTRQTEIAALLAPYGPPKPETTPTRQDETT